MTPSEILMGRRIKQKRIELGYSQDELAQKCGFAGRSSISKVEVGERGLPANKIAALSDVLGVSPVWIMGIDDETMGKAVDYEISMIDYPQLKELNAIIKEHHSDEEFLRRMVEYAQFLSSRK